MEELISLIIYLLEKAAKAREEKGTSKAQQLARQKPLPAQQAAAVRKPMESQQQRTHPSAARPKAVKQVAANAPTTWSQPAAIRAARVPAPAVRAVAAVDAPRRPIRKGWQIPLLMGEILGPPPALREPEV